MSAGAAAAVILGAYLLGSISWSYLIVKLTQGRDIRTVGSGNAGATNVMRAAGKAAGAAALVLDLGKGIAAVEVARALAAPAPVVAGAAVAVVLGHVFPVFFGLRGGKGVATAAGALGALAPAALLAALLVFAVLVAWKRYVSLGSVVTAALFPLLVWAAPRWAGGTAGGGWPVAAAAAIALVVIVKHRGNLRRLRLGTERRLGEPRPGGPAGAAPGERPGGPTSVAAGEVCPGGPAGAAPGEPRAGVLANTPPEEAGRSSPFNAAPGEPPRAGKVPPR
jgi:glycerol-3-phosphate acyltransferase PlsY